MPIKPSILLQLKNNDPSLKKLDLSSSLPFNKLTDNDIFPLCDALKGNTYLKELNLSDNKITDVGVLALVAALAQNFSLKILDLSDNKIEDKGAIELAQTRLEVLNLGGNKITDKGGVMLAQNNYFKSLNLNANSIGDISAEAFSKNKILLHLYLNAGLFNVFGNKISDEGAIALAKMQLQILSLHENKIGNDGAIALAGNTYLTDLDLSGNSDIKANAANKFLSNDNLTTFDLNDTFKPEDIRSFFNDTSKEEALMVAINKKIEKNKGLTLSLIAACKMQNNARAGELLKQNVRPYGTYLDEELGKGNTLLKLAKNQNNQPLMDLLVRFGAQMYAIGDAEATPAPMVSNNNATSQQAASPTTINKIDVAVEKYKQPAIQNADPAQKPSQDQMPDINSNNFAIPYHTLKLSDRLGEGAYGVVFKATHGYETVAVKKLNIEKDDKKALDSFLSEAQQMFQLHSDYTVRLKGICNEPYCLILEFMSGGSLYAYLKNNESTAVMWLQRIKMALDLSYGLAYLHGKHVIHRDLKSLNVLLDDRGRAKLSDFGLTITKSTSSSAAKTKSACGTTAWMAPELLDPEVDEYEYTTQTDIFSYAMVLYELASHKVPFQELKESQIPGKILSNKRPEIPNTSPEDYTKLIIRCWHQTPGARPTVDAAINELNNLKQIEETKNEAPKYPSMFTK